MHQSSLRELRLTVVLGAFGELRISVQNEALIEIDSIPQFSLPGLCENVVADLLGI